MKGPRFTAYCLATVLCAVSCTTTPKEGRATSAKQSSPTTVLIVSESSEFKAAVVEQVQEKLKQKNCAIRTIGLEQLCNETAAQYRAVVILNSIRAWQMRGPVRDFLANTPKNIKPRIIVVGTCRGGHWKKDAEVHAITAASKPVDMERVTTGIITRVNHILQEDG